MHGSAAYSLVLRSLRRLRLAHLGLAHCLKLREGCRRTWRDGGCHGTFKSSHLGYAYLHDHVARSSLCVWLGWTRLLREGGRGRGERRRCGRGLRGGRDAAGGAAAAAALERQRRPHLGGSTSATTGSEFVIPRGVLSVLDLGGARLCRLESLAEVAERHLPLQLTARLPTKGIREEESGQGSGTPRHSEALRGTPRHSEALRGTQGHSGALRGTPRHSEALACSSTISSGDLPSTARRIGIIDASRHTSCRSAPEYPRVRSASTVKSTP